MADIRTGQSRMKDRLFAAKRMPILAIVNLFLMDMDADIHTLGQAIHAVPPRIMCVIWGRPSKVRTLSRVSERCLFGTGSFQWAVLSCPFYHLFFLSEAAGALYRVSLRELPLQISTLLQSLTTPVR